MIGRGESQGALAAKSGLLPRRREGGEPFKNSWRASLRTQGRGELDRHGISPVLSSALSRRSARL